MKSSWPATPIRLPSGSVRCPTASLPFGLATGPMTSSRRACASRGRARNSASGTRTVILGPLPRVRPMRAFVVGRLSPEAPRHRPVDQLGCGVDGHVAISLPAHAEVKRQRHGMAMSDDEPDTPPSSRRLARGTPSRARWLFGGLFSASDKTPARREHRNADPPRSRTSSRIGASRGLRRTQPSAPTPLHSDHVAGDPIGPREKVVRVAGTVASLHS